MGSLVNPDVQTLNEASATENTNRTNLAIDKSNTINLQKAIDQYYDGELSMDYSLLHNGDILSMQLADKQRSQSSQAVESRKGRSNSSQLPITIQKQSSGSYIAVADYA